MAENPLIRQDEIKRLVDSGLAMDDDAAGSIIDRRRTLDGYLFYHQDASRVVKSAFERGIREEEIYCSSQLRYGLIKLGRLGKARRYGYDNGYLSFREKRLAIAKLGEWVPKNHLESETVGEVGDPATIRHFAYCSNLDGNIGGKEGFVLTPFSQEELRTRGVISFAERSPKGIEAIEYTPIIGDDILGMFGAFRLHPIGEQRDLVLWVPRVGVIWR